MDFPQNLERKIKEGISVKGENISKNCRMVCRHQSKLIPIVEREIPPRSLWSFLGSVVEHWSAESEGLRFDSSWGLRIFSLSHAYDKTKNTKNKIFLYFILIFVKKIIQFLFQLSFVKYLPSYMVAYRGHATD